MQYIIRKSFFFLISLVTMNILQKLIQIFSVTNWETRGKFYDVWAVHANKHGRSGDFLSHIPIRIIYRQLCWTGISHEKHQSIEICVLLVQIWLLDFSKILFVSMLSDIKKIPFSHFSVFTVVFFFASLLKIWTYM